MFRHFFFGLIVTVTVASTISQSARGQDIGFIERFALSEDRQATLAELVPGTADYYFFHCLHYQNTGQFDQAATTLKTWEGRLGNSPRLRQIQHRQALLTYADTPDESLAYLIDKLDLSFDHQRRRSSAEPGLATRLDPSLIGFERLNRRALSRSNTGRYEDLALVRVASQSLNDSQLRHLLQRLRHPAVPDLPKLIARDLQNRDAEPFGSYTIHQNLTIDQLDELASLRPQLRNESNFVNAYLIRLLPDHDVNWRHDREAQRAYLDRLWQFVADLDPAHNSLKASVLFRRLELDLALGVYNRDLFLEYLKLPRQTPYINRRWVNEVRSSRNMVDLNADYRKQTRLTPIRSDEPLIRKYLHHFLADAPGYKEFSPWISDDYLKQRFAEAKITAGLGDPEQWASMLSPAAYQTLMKRIDLDFDPANPVDYQVDEPVEIRLTTKNVKNLIVKIFEINTANFYRTQHREINTDINLDGLVPNWQRTFDYDDPPALRVERTFRFDEIDHRGVFIIDFIGNGKSSRALIRKGRLSHLVETTVAGQRFSVFDESGQRVKDATIWISGRDYQAGDDGRILVPFSTQPGRESVVIEHDGLSVLSQFSHHAESYELQAGIYVDRESLVRGGKASVIVRPQLRVAGQPAPLGILKQVSLMVRATNLDGIESTREFRDLKLAEEHETEVEIVVPARLRKLHFELKATVENVSRSQPQNLAAAQSFGVNEIDTTPLLQTVHLRQNPAGYQLAVRGKTGESRKAQAVSLRLKHRLFAEPVEVSLQSDAKGQIELGELADISWIEVVPNDGPARRWDLGMSRETVHGTINAATGQVIRIPCDTRLPDTRFALLELRGNAYYRDRSSEVAAKDGIIAIGPLPAGDYQLRNQRTGQTRRIQVTAGPLRENFVMGSWRTLEIRDPQPLHVREIVTTDEKVKITLGGDGRYARVHVLATRYQPRFSAFRELARVGDIEPVSIRLGYHPSAYIAGRTLGEEYQYILNRRYLKKYPGNMLTRPSLLLNPWDLRTTENELQVAQAGDDFARALGGDSSSAARGQANAGQTAITDDFASLDFLAGGSVELVNLLPDENGVVEIDRELLGEKHMLQIVVQDHFQTLMRQAILPESPLKYRDMRLADALDADRHFAQQKQYTVLKADEEFELNDVSSARFRTYDSLNDVYRYYVTLTGNPQLAEFGFLMQWPDKSDEEKLDLYKRYACHEFNFFLLHKDPEYFESVIVPYLGNKLHPTFLDQYLLKLGLRDWLNPWEFKRLNTLEQILLGRREGDRRQRLNQFVGDDYDSHPTTRRSFDRLYEFAVLGSALDDDEALAERSKGSKLKRDALLREGIVDELQAAQPESEEAVGDMAVAGKVALPTPENSARESAGEPMAGRRLRGRPKRAEDRYDDKARAPAPPGAGGGGGFGGGGERFYSRELRDLQEKRKSLQQFYNRIGPTREWVENNYYRLPIEQQNAELVRVNRFWRDYALHTGETPFLSPYFAESARNFTEMMLALAVLDLPFEDPEHETVYVDNTMKMTPRGNLIAFYEQVRPAVFDRGESTVLVSENFYRADDRYRVVDGKTSEKFVRKEFLDHVLYGGQVVITNPTSTAREIDLLIQIPEGAIPAAASHETRTMQMDLAAFSTQTVEYYFYFPTPGDFTHYPAHVSTDARVLAVADPLRFNVVEEPSEVDTGSWAYLSQNGTEQQVLDYLNSENLQPVDLEWIAFRMKNREFYDEAIRILKKRFAFHSVLWSYALKHNDPEQIGQFLKHAEGFVSECGIYLQSELLQIHPVIRLAYQHREYWPLVNARAHQLGSNRKILNQAIWQQYHQLLDIIARQTSPGDEAHLATTYYLLLQDRVTEAIGHFRKVSADRLATQLQYDYCAAYIAMYQSRPEEAGQIAGRYTSYPVQRWRDLFAAVASQVREIAGGATVAADERDASQRQTEAASQTPNFEFVVEARKTKLDFQNLTGVTINYYQMDVELLFSRNPFVKRQDEGFALIRPNETQTVSLPAGQSNLEIDLPEQFRNSNVLVEVNAAGKTERQAYYANSMNVQLIESFGQLKVTESDSGELLPQVYVKVYARKADGSVHFYKDGYTDLRGRFDYVSLGNQNLGEVRRFAVLLISDEYGAVVREAGVPKE